MELTIAFVAGQLSGGGAERQFLYLLRGLRARGVRVTVATLHPEDPAEAVAEAAIEALGIPVHRIPRSRWKVDRVAHMAAWLRRERPLLVHSWAFHGNIYAAWAGALAGVPVRVGSLQGDLFYENTVQWQAPPLFMRLALAAPHAVMVNSGAAAAAIEQWKPRRARLRVVRNGMDITLFQSPAEEASPEGVVPADCAGSLLRSSGNRPGPVLVQVGSLIPRKNVPMFLRVVAALAERYPGLEGWLIGDGSERAALETLAEEMGVAPRVRFWGRQADVAALLRRADILCHCSYSEGICNVIMEGSALGLPVVVTRAGGVAEIVEDGATGFLVDPDDDAAMIHCVDRLLREPGLREGLGEAGCQKMRREFSLERLVGDMVAFYRDLLDERGQNGSLLEFSLTPGG